MYSFQKKTGNDPEPLRMFRPSSLACLKVIKSGVL
jgi:hypothetical protein